MAEESAKVKAREFEEF
jgi:DNA gyrase/topoisomerase IV subunit A